MDITLVIPTYNEAENVPILLENVYRIFAEHGLDGSVMIVDDNSPDGTWKVAEELKDKYRGLRVLEGCVRGGFNRVLRKA
jgi:dolichol-phosphate mannosyltransferase